MNSKHYEEERKLRDLIIRAIGLGNVIKVKEFDKGHVNGPEIHVLSDTGIITIYNKATKKMVTRLIARPGQVKRFYADNERIPRDLMQKAREHTNMGWNEA